VESSAGRRRQISILDALHFDDELPGALKLSQSGIFASLASHIEAEIPHPRARLNV
jgi:hypothetical protein